MSAPDPLDVIEETPQQDIQFIHTPEQLATLADEHGLRLDWHEPDEQDVDAFVYGGHLDNAMGPGYLPKPWELPSLRHINYSRRQGELNVVLTKEHRYEDGSSFEKAIAVVNLADLLAWASRTHRNEN